MRSVLFDECKMKDTRFYNLTLKQFYLNNSDMENLELINTKLKEIDLSSCNITNLKANSTDIEGMIIESYQLLEIASLFGVKIKESI